MADASDVNLSLSADSPAGGFGGIPPNRSPSTSSLPGPSSVSPTGATLPRTQGSITKILDNNLDGLALARSTTPEGARMSDPKYRKWGPYVSDRAWGTVREDYSHDGNAWDSFPFEHAHSRAYRWNEDGIAGFCNESQNVCLSLGLWNERDPIIKERFYGLTGPQGSHGEDVKEYYFYQTATPSYSYCKMNYKYCHRMYPYKALHDGNSSYVRQKHQGELELMDILGEDFASGKYFDVDVEYAKEDSLEDIVCKITVTNRAKPVPTDALHKAQAEREARHARVKRKEERRVAKEKAAELAAAQAEQDKSSDNGSGSNSESNEGGGSESCSGGEQGSQESEGEGQNNSSEDEANASDASTEHVMSQEEEDDAFDDDVDVDEELSLDGSAVVHVLAQSFFRNRWSWGHEGSKHPQWQPVSGSCIEADSFETDVGVRHISFVDQYEQPPLELLFCENETNIQKLFDGTNAHDTAKDGINDYLVHDDKNAVKVVTTANFKSSVGGGGGNHGGEHVDVVKASKCAAHFTRNLAPGETYVVYMRMSQVTPEVVGSTCDPKSAHKHSAQALSTVVVLRKHECVQYYHVIQNSRLSTEERLVQRQAWAGLLWSCQYYHYHVKQWLEGDPWQEPPPKSRQKIRNQEWIRFHAGDVISMPDKWEYPWFAAWDLAFHVVPLAYLDPTFCKAQLILMLREWYSHPNGQLPAYEWNFSDTNPPVHAWACWRVYSIEKKCYGNGDILFLKRAYNKLVINFTWWVNRKDKTGRHIFEGGFLGLDNISVFDRSGPGLPKGDELHQADGTAWMAMYALDMLRIALELAQHDESYEDGATKFFEHFVFIAAAINGVRPKIGQESGDHGLWNDKQGFYFDHIKHADGRRTVLEVFSYVGLIPMFAVEIIPRRVFEKLHNFKKQVVWFAEHHPELVDAVPNLMSSVMNPGQNIMLSIVDKSQLERMLKRMVNTDEFLSPHGIRSLSKFHLENPFTYEGKSIGYEPAESQTFLFGGNSNWRGCVWMPINYLIIESLHRYNFWYGKSLTVRLNLWEELGTVALDMDELAYELKARLVSIFLKRKPQAKEGAKSASATGGPPAENLLQAAKRLGWYRSRSSHDMKSMGVPSMGMGSIEETEGDEDDNGEGEIDHEDGYGYEGIAAVAKEKNTSGGGSELGRPCNGEDSVFASDPHWKDNVLFYEYFHADTGQGLGASHQTGWTALVAKILQGSGQFFNGAFRY